MYILYGTLFADHSESTYIILSLSFYLYCVVPFCWGYMCNLKIL